MADPRLSLVDDATAIRAAVPALLPTTTIVSTHSRVEDFLAASPDCDVVAVDLQLVNETQPGALQGVAAVAAVADAGYRVCVYTQEERRFVLASCLAAGALGAVSKSAPLEVARAAFEGVARGELVAPPAVVGILEVLSKRGRLTLLTDRQREVLNGRARGLTYDELARTVHVSPSTLRSCWRDITEVVGRHLSEVSPGDIEHAFGLRPGDLVGVWPVQPASVPSARPTRRPR
ncbi:response regulator transcription factor [Nocardioides plantarum]|uniref:Response regulator transcription factor n=1 Tax=Nocardioides plantarum TaxID=29299 RepID=A0ABV5KBA4_9ACTN|nr:response regulator transcription factor [Nocardioides plantarum]